MTPWLSDPDVTLYHGDALAVLRELPDESVHCIATSPPFYALRDYGVEGQIGLEETPDAWAASLVAVFREARRVLRKDGTLWVECGDSYMSAQGGRQSAEGLLPHERTSLINEGWNGQKGDTTKVVAARSATLKAKDLIGQPWLLAFALRADGWWLRGCNIWAKPNAMPESAKDRCTTAHSYVFHLSKSARYFFDGDAISEPAAWERWGDQTVPKHEGTETAAGWIKPKTKEELTGSSLPGAESRETLAVDPGTSQPARVKTKKPDGWDTGDGGHGSIHRNGREKGVANEVARGAKHPRSVWSIPTQGYPEAHFATWPEKLAERIIKCSTSERGVCPECGAPWVREVEQVSASEPYRNGPAYVHNEVARQSRGRRNLKAGLTHGSTLGWRPSCEAGGFDWEGNELQSVPERLSPVPATVLDPFAGSGTTLYVARKLGRRGIGIDLNAEYLDMAARRLQQQSLFAEATS